MSDFAPERKFFPVAIGGPLDEGRPGSKVGDLGGLTIADNVIYRPYGSWGRRAGSKLAYTSGTVGPVGIGNPVGTRWSGTNGTKTVVVTQGAIWTGGDPNVGSPAALTNIFSGTAMYSSPASLTSIYDPQDAGTGKDILVICGMTSASGVASVASYQVVGPNTTIAGVTFTMTFHNGGTAVPVTYTSVSTDTGVSVAQELASLINASAACVGASAFIAPVLYESDPANPGPPAGGVLVISALTSGTGGNAYTITNTIANAGTYNYILGTQVGNGTSTSTFSGGGASVSGPLRYDGTNVNLLSKVISGALNITPTGCVAWHNHLWLWGDSNNPDSLYASDLAQPESYQFMLTNGPYLVGQGDGAGGIQSCVPMGDSLYIFKRNSVYIMTGYDFQSAATSFSISSQVIASGIPAANCVCVMNNALYYWDGGKFCRLVSGSFLPENISVTIPATVGRIAAGNAANRFTCVGGSFIYQTDVNVVQNYAVMSNCVVFSCVDAYNDPITLVYDDDATNFIGEYCWSTWDNFNSASGNTAFILFSNSPQTSTPTITDPKVLLYMLNNNSTTLKVYEYGADASLDQGTSEVTWITQTGWITLGTSAKLKMLHRIFLHFEATANVAGTIALGTGSFNTGSALVIEGVTNPTFPGTVAVPFSTKSTYQVPLVLVTPPQMSYAFQLQLNLGIASSGEGVFSLVGITFDYLEEAFTP